MIHHKQFKSLYDLLERFPTELSCHEYIASQRWGGYMECPFEGCSGDQAYVFSDGIRYKCKCCKRKYTVKTGSFLEGTHLQLRKWLIAVYLVMHKKGISSHQLAKDVGVTQKTAWFMLGRIRQVFANDVLKDQPLDGVVQLDETFVGGKNINRHYDKKVQGNQGRSFKDKTPVFGMLRQQEYEYVDKVHPSGVVIKELVIKRPSVLICHVVRDTTVRNIQPHIMRSVIPATTLVSDEWKAYKGLHYTYNHKVVDHGRHNYVTDDGYTTNALEGAWKALKASIKSIHHYVTPRHLNRYVQEFVFRYNYRNFDIPQQMNVVFGNMHFRIKYRDLIKKAA